jgi:methylated-DNA-protein-cysteine methyltransferase-like protein
MTTKYQQIYALVRKVPKGKVATYGQIAYQLDRCTPRMVGYAMAALMEKDVPWQRIVNAQGGISPRASGDGALIQRKLLEAEGVAFNENGRIDLKKHRVTHIE